MKKSVAINDDKIVDLLAELDATQTGLADVSGVSFRTISRSLNETKSCHRSTLEKLVKGFNKLESKRFGRKARKWTVEDFLAELPSPDPATKPVPARQVPPSKPDNLPTTRDPKTKAEELARKVPSTRTRVRRTVLSVCAVALLVAGVAIIRIKSTDESISELKPVEFAPNGRLDEANKRMRQGAEFVSWTESREALRAFEKAYEIRRKQLGEDAKATLESRRQIALAHYWLADFEQAEEIQLAILERLKDQEEQALTYGVMSDLALTLSDQGKATEGLQWVAKDRLISLEGKQGPNSLAARHDTLFKAFHLNSEAIEGELREVLADMMATHGERHPHTIACLMNLGVFYLGMQNEPNALDALTEARTLAEKHLGMDNLWTVLILTNLAVVHKGSLEETHKLADQLCESFDQVRKRTPTDHPTMLEIGQRVAAVSSKTGKNEQGIALMKEVLDATEQRFGKEHELTWQRRHLLAIHYKAAQLVHEAIPLFESVRDYRQKNNDQGSVANINVDIMACRALGAFDYLGIGSPQRKAMDALGSGVFSEFSKRISGGPKEESRTTKTPVERE